MLKKTLCLAAASALASLCLACFAPSLNIYTARRPLNPGDGFSYSAQEARARNYVIVPHSYGRKESALNSAKPQKETCFEKAKSFCGKNPAFSKDAGAELFSAKERKEERSGKANAALYFSAETEQKDSDGFAAAYTAECFSAFSISEIIKQTRAKEEEEKPVKIQLIGRGKSYQYEDKKTEPTDHLVAEEIYSRGVNLAADQKLKIMDKCLEAGSDFKHAVLFCMPKFRCVVDKALEDSRDAPKNAEIFFYPERRPMFVIRREKTGLGAAEQDVYRDVYFALKRRARLAGGEAVRVELPIKILFPEVTAEMLTKVTGLRSHFKTSFSEANFNRACNIALAMKRISGTRLDPGGEFSFNTAVGPRTEESGFKEARIIVAGEYTDGIGGGVCQASTTLYNAALKADMKITAVKSHTLISSYVAPSFDAMVNSGSSDLKFVNEGELPVFIRTYAANGGIAAAEFYGAELPYSIEFESVELKRGKAPGDAEIVDKEGKYIKEKLPSGTKVRISYPHASLSSEGYLKYIDKSGRLIRREKIRSDSYRESRGIIAVAP